MTTLTDLIQNNGSQLTEWNDSLSSKAVQGLLPPYPWAENEQELSLNGKFFSYMQNDSIGGHLSIQAFSIEGTTPLESYLREVDSFDGGRLEQGTAEWTHWNVDNEQKYAVSSAALGPSRLGVSMQVAYVWTRQSLLSVDTLLIVTVLNLSGIPFHLGDFISKKIS
ncbi:Hypothetical protein CGLY_00470 [Corynebacterium glyciniphilum AJ 3170]|uniref:Uncharacterized protein n=1 Tax=Corynebacterium glyciniphilum AJ 3170 TaxID=1404245 RepID=X5DPF2_9CORY|nr:hypothetical protein [Corynebacterium glyciniphilum]AHW62542.1 Hypothetical protein CGLY_00470 [Corynebacterium glyciniphilum AJ 3170]